MIRVMLCGLAPVLAEASRRILDESADMTCAGDESLLDVERGATSNPFDVLLLGASVPGAAEPSRRLLDADPHLKIVCVSPDGREAVLQERRLDRIPVENVNFERIFTALREACNAEKAN